MKATWIYPEDIGADSKYSHAWKVFCDKLGYYVGDNSSLPEAILITVIETNQ
jgi:hypothetical protein